MRKAFTLIELMIVISIILIIAAIAIPNLMEAGRPHSASQPNEQRAAPISQPAPIVNEKRAAPATPAQVEK